MIAVTGAARHSGTAFRTLLGDDAAFYASGGTRSDRPGRAAKKEEPPAHPVGGAAAKADAVPPFSPGLVSVIMPAYNHERFVAEAIESVLNQTYSPIQLVVVNDGSTDSTGEVIRSLEDKCNSRLERFTLVEQPNRGVVASLRKALEFLEGEYVSLLGSDDRFHTDKIEVLVDAIGRAPPGTGVVVGDARFIDSAGVATGRLRSGRTYTSFLGYFLHDHDEVELGSYSSLLRGNYLPAMSALIRSDVLLSSGGFERGRLLEDWPLWLRLSRVSRIQVVERVVADYRLHGGNLTSSAVPKLWGEVMSMLLEERIYCREDRHLQTVWADTYIDTLRTLLIKRCWHEARKAVREVPVREWRPELVGRLIRGLRVNGGC